MGSEFRGDPEDAANWHPARNQEPDHGMTPEEIAATVQILETTQTQVPTRRDSPRAFYQDHVSSPINHPVFRDAEVAQGSLDIFLSQHAENRMIDHLDSAVPLEAIGLVLGRIGIDRVVDQDRTYVELKETIPMRPIDDTARTTAVSATLTCNGWIRAWNILDYLRKTQPDTYEDVHIIGWYHQHPIGTSLSEMDVFLHNAAFGEPHQIAFVRNSSNGSTGVFYRSVEIGKEKRLVAEDHFRQTSGYYYEGTKPVAYDIVEYLQKMKHETDPSKPVDIEELKRNIREQLTPWLTEPEIEHELSEMIKAAGMIAFEEIVENPKVIITPEEPQWVDDVLDFTYLVPTVDTVANFLGEIAIEENDNSDLIQIEDDEPQKLKSLLHKLQNTVGDTLIRLGKRIKKD